MSIEDRYEVQAFEWHNKTISQGQSQNLRSSKSNNSIVQFLIYIFQDRP